MYCPSVYSPCVHSPCVHCLFFPSSYCTVHTHMYCTYLALPLCPCARVPPSFSAPVPALPCPCAPTVVYRPWNRNRDPQLQRQEQPTVLHSLLLQATAHTPFPFPAVPTHAMHPNRRPTRISPIFWPFGTEMCLNSASTRRARGLTQVHLLLLRRRAILAAYKDTPPPSQTSEAVSPTYHPGCYSIWSVSMHH